MISERSTDKAYFELFLETPGGSLPEAREAPLAIGVINTPHGTKVTSVGAPAAYLHQKEVAEFCLRGNNRRTGGETVEVFGMLPHNSGGGRPVCRHE